MVFRIIVNNIREQLKAVVCSINCSFSSRCCDQYDHPEYKSAVKYIIDKSKSKGIPTLVHQQTVELTKEWIENGSTFVLYSSDSRMINPFVNEIDYIKSIGNQILGKNHQKIGDLEDLGDVI